MTPRDGSRLARLEREAVLEWILLRRYMLLWLILGAGLLASAAAGILYADGVSHLNRRELQRFGLQQRQLREHSPYQEGLIHERISPE